MRIAAFLAALTWATLVPAQPDFTPDVDDFGVFYTLMPIVEDGTALPQPVRPVLPRGWSNHFMYFPAKADCDTFAENQNEAYRGVHFMVDDAPHLMIFGCQQIEEVP